MTKCFVIQPFDKDKFDRRFDDHIAPAIKKAGLEPYRVDRDPSVRVPIESIHAGIMDAEACLVDITTNNPNVWYELGFALASGKEVVLVCSNERNDSFPFDVRHLTIINYSTGSGSDFLKLEENITAKLLARLHERRNLQTIASMSPLSEFEGLSPHETAALSVMMAEVVTPDSLVDPWEVRTEMQKAGFTMIAVNLSSESLIRKGMVSVVDTETDYDGQRKMYKIEKSGIDWLMSNQDKLVLRQEKMQTPSRAPVPQQKNLTSRDDDFDDSDPFADE